MAAIFLLGVGILFLVMGHSTLLFFKAKEHRIMKVQELIVPWPNKGKFVSFLCLILSAIFIFVSFSFGIQMRYIFSPAGARFFLAFAIFPLGVYSYYIKNRVRKSPSGIIFLATEPSKIEWRLPLILVAIASALSIYFK